MLNKKTQLELVSLLNVWKKNRLLWEHFKNKSTYLKFILHL